MAKKKKDQLMQKIADLSQSGQNVDEQICKLIRDEIKKVKNQMNRLAEEEDDCPTDEIDEQMDALDSRLFHLEEMLSQYGK